MYDMIFISYGEPNAEENYKKLKSRFPLLKRVKDVEGIHNAHLAAAKKSFTEMFWVIDGDADVLDSFDFSYQAPEWDYDAVHVWRSRNPVNGLEYGYGGVKLLPKKQTLEMDTSKPDMTTSIGTRFNAMPEVSNNTAFNTDAFSAWRSGFRECCKLASKTINNQVDTETSIRLKVWCSVGEDKPFGHDAIRGALAGRSYGEYNQDNPEALLLINNYNWLREQYEKNT